MRPVAYRSTLLEPVTGRERKVLLIALLPAAVTVAICASQLATGAHWSGVDGYDDGVYVSSAVDLVHGILPYSDYVYVQPPGIMLVLSPIAALCRLFGLGSQDVLIASRIFTGLLAGVATFLVALLVRHKGTVAMVLSGLVFATFPAAYLADSSAYIEPYLDVFCLLGLILIFRGDQVSERAFTYAAGLCFGVGADFKLWALLPAGLLFLWLWPSGPRRSLRLLAGVVTGIAVVMVPFLAMAPGGFVRDVFTAQVNRVAGFSRHEVHRLILVAGYWPLHLGWPFGALGGIVLVAVGLGAAWRAKSTQKVSSLAVFLSIMTVGVTVVLLTLSPFYTHYPYFLVMFAAPLFGLAVASAISALPASSWRICGRAAIALGLLVGGIMSYRSVSSFASSGTNRADTAASHLLWRVPANACVLSDEVSYALSANRLAAAYPRCPAVLDAYGTQLVERELTAGRPASVERRLLAARWQRWLGESQYVIFSTDFTHRLAWTQELASWFKGHYVRLASAGSATLYRRRT